MKGFLFCVLFMCLTQVLSDSNCGEVNCKENECCVKTKKKSSCVADPLEGAKCSSTKGCKECADGLTCVKKKCVNPDTIPNCGKELHCKEDECCFKKSKKEYVCLAEPNEGEKCTKVKGCKECATGLMCNEGGVCGGSGATEPECWQTHCLENECCFNTIENECCCFGASNCSMPRQKGEACLKKKGCADCGEGLTCNSSLLCDEAKNGTDVNGGANCGDLHCEADECCSEIFGVASCVKPRQRGEKCIKWFGCKECDDGLVCQSNICHDPHENNGKPNCGILHCNETECCLTNKKTKEKVCRAEPQKGEQCTLQKGCKECADGFACNPMANYTCDIPSNIPPPNCGKHYCTGDDCCWANTCHPAHTKGEKCIKMQGCKECATGFVCNSDTNRCDTPLVLSAPNCGNLFCEENECCVNILGMFTCNKPREKGEECLKWKDCKECADGLVCKCGQCAEPMNFDFNMTDPGTTGGN